MNILERETRWRGPEKRDRLSHADCEAHGTAGYLFQRTHGASLLGLEVAASIRFNKLSQSQGERLLMDEEKRLKVYPRESMVALSKVSGISTTNIRLLPIRIRARKYLKNTVKKVY